MKVKGFTLIELLAVIVILAIIALIAVPIILNIVGSSKKSSILRSGELYLKAVETSIARKNLNEQFNPSICTIEMDGNLTCTVGETEIPLVVEVNGNKPTSGIIELTNGKITKVTGMILDGYELEKTDGRLKIVGTSTEPVTPPAPVEPEQSFEKDSWETIISNVKEGNIDKYEVGDTKEVDLGDLGTHTLRIANTTTPEECNTEGFSQTACGFVLEFADIVTKQTMNSTETNVGGWEASKLRTYVNDTIYNSLPDEIKSSIIDTYVVSGHGKTSGETNLITTDKLYLLSTREIWDLSGSPGNLDYDEAKAETRQLDYYNSVGAATTDKSGVIKKYNEKAIYWWLRSAFSSNTFMFYGVQNNGSSFFDSATYSYGVSPAFRIG